MSPYIFVLPAEILAEYIRQNSKNTGLKIHGEEHRVSQYVDDTTLFIKQKREYLAE